MAVQALEEAGAHIKGMMAIFTYGFDVAKENFEQEKVTLHTLSDYDNLLEQALKTRYISEKEKYTLEGWRMDPANWSAPTK